MTLPSKRKAFSMMELLVGIIIFALAILPLIWLSSSQTKGAYSVGKHMMAGQLATSFLDEKLKLSFDECVQNVKEISARGRKLVLNNENLIEMIEHLNNDTAINDINASFKNFYYKFTFDDSEIDKKIFRINIEVFYRIADGDPKSEQSVKLSVIKYGERNG